MQCRRADSRQAYFPSFSRLAWLTSGLWHSPGSLSSSPLLVPSSPLETDAQPEELIPLSCPESALSTSPWPDARDRPAEDTLSVCPLKSAETGTGEAAVTENAQALLSGWGEVCGSAALLGLARCASSTVWRKRNMMMMRCCIAQSLCAIVACSVGALSRVVSFETCCQWALLSVQIT